MRAFIDFLRTTDGTERFFIGMLFVLTVLFVWATYMMIVDAEEWSRYAEEYDCERIDSKTRVNIVMIPRTTGNGGVMMIPTTRTQYLWHCNVNGYEVWR